MSWRIHFTPGDLARTTVGAPLGPLAETTMAMSLLQCPLQRSLFTHWRGQVGGRLSPRLRPFAALVPAGSSGVDLGSVTGDPPTIELGTGALLAAPRELLLAEMTDLDHRSRLPVSAWAAAEPGSDDRLRLAEAVDAAYRALVEPYWTRIQTGLRSEQALRGQVMISGGVERLLTTLYAPRIRWRPPVLEILAPVQADFYLDGSGLELVPSVFVGALPSLALSLHDQAVPPKLIFPAGRDPADGTLPWPGSVPDAGLAALLGRTRAAVLGSVAAGCTTTELAARVGISAGAASQHATVLRAAGLITTRREGSAVRHTLTALGAALLAGRAPDAIAGELTSLSVLRNPARRRRWQHERDDRVARRAAAAARLRMPAGARAGAGHAGRCRRVPARPRDADPYPRLRAAQPVPGLSRAAVPAGGARFRQLAGHQVAVGRRAGRPR
jgi:DNA-binding transcriptional ArsR family regulator